MLHSASSPCTGIHFLTSKTVPGDTGRSKLLPSIAVIQLNFVQPDPSNTVVIYLYKYTLMHDILIVNDIRLRLSGESEENMRLPARAITLFYSAQYVSIKMLD